MPMPAKPRSSNRNPGHRLTEAVPLEEAITLEDVPAGDQQELADAQHIAMVRLLLYITGEVHRLVNEVTEAALEPLLKAPADEPLQLIDALAAQTAMRAAWSSFIKEYAELMGRGMQQAASIPFGMLAIMHEKMIVPHLDEEETAAESIGRRRGHELREQVAPNPDIFVALLQQTLNIARTRSGPDGLNLSHRIWRLDKVSRRNIENTLVGAVANSQSAWDTSKQLQQYLGAGADCPRWTSTRLNQLAKGEIAAGRQTGLYSGSDCAGQGVAYNALRLARNEMQTVLNMSTDATFAKMPWIEREQILLSSEHPKQDICDDVATGGDDGDGIYPKGEISLPLHVQCLCYKVAMLMDNDLFVDRLRSWMGGTAAWTEMDDYADMLGGSVNVSLMKISQGLALANWLIGSVTQLNTAFWG